MEDAYAILNLDSGASVDDIKAAYHRLVRRYPPEINPRRFARVKQAYEFLSSYERRMRHAAGDLHEGLDLLFPKVKAVLLPPPEPPEPLGSDDWGSLIKPLREQIIRAILADGFSTKAPGESGI